MPELVQELKHRLSSRVVIYDRPPLLHTADVFAFSPYTETLLLVVEQGKTTAEDVRRALSLVNDSRPVSETVLNTAGQLAVTPANKKQLLLLYRREC